MRIAWVTPLSERSAIGHVTVRVAEQLRRYAEVDLWCSDTDATIATDVPVVRYTVSPAAERWLSEYDTVLYNFGDHYAFHRDAFLMSLRVPGVAVLHDFVLHHFFMGYFLERPDRIDAYVAAMERAYGAEGREAAMASFSQVDGQWRQRSDRPALWTTDRVVDFPLFEPAIRLATGVVVHSEFLRDRVRQVVDAPCRRLFLPAPRAQAPPDPPVELDVPAGRAVLLTIGHVNPNKRVSSVIEALGRHPDIAARVQYVVIGELPPGGYADELRAAIAKWNLDDVVRLLGRQSDDMLSAWLSRADVCINLRHPVMEGASASLTEQMWAGKPAIVTNAGVYAEVPDDCAVKVDAGREVEDLPGVLRQLLDDPDSRQARGRRAGQYASTHFRADRYAEDLFRFIVDSGGFAAMATYASRVAGTLRQMGVQPGMEIVDTVAQISAELFGAPASSPWGRVIEPPEPSREA